MLDAMLAKALGLTKPKSGAKAVLSPHGGIAGRA